MASLKLVARVKAAHVTSPFPWSKDHGLIEAMVFHVFPKGRGNGFPWSKDHGLIEATATINTATRLVMSFHGRKIMASLKRL